MDNMEKVHFVGIGGISMSGLAEMLHSRGLIISGSDAKESDTTTRLRKIGITVLEGHRAENITEDLDMVVYTAAVKEDNPEIIAAKKLNVELVDRAALIGRIMKYYNCPICISGTHGKTTTTSMVADIFLAAGKNPAINVGGVMPSINASFSTGAESRNYFILEACEYSNSFLNFYPAIAIILNIEADHLDYFGGLDDIRHSFRRFAENIRPGGLLIIHHNIEGLEELVAGLNCKVVTYGIDKGDWQAANISFDEEGFASFDCIYNNKNLGRLNLQLRGLHNVKNTLAACAAATDQGLSFSFLQESLKQFEPPKRRFEIKGKANGICVVDDYAHHPTEIKATLQAAKNTPHRQIWCVFQPHTYTRTKLLLHELADSFDNADNVVLLDIYAAREVNKEEIHSRDLLELLRKRQKNAFYFDNFSEAENFLIKNCIHGDLLITMGAGDVYILGERIIRTKFSTLST